MVRKLAENHGIRTTEQKDRNYFRSVYFREPGGVLFEIATDQPRLLNRRARRNARRSAEAAAVPREAPQGDRGRAAADRGVREEK